MTEMDETRLRYMREASLLSERVNKDRFEGSIPSAEHTVRLIEILDILLLMELS